jgi:hypothetical protein
MGIFIKIVSDFGAHRVVAGNDPKRGGDVLKLELAPAA